MTRLYLASNNAHKAVEMRALLAPVRPDWEICLAKDAAPGITWQEDGDSFIANARIKAATLQAALGSTAVPGAILADDSGLQVDVLGGLPGVHSSRYAGVDGDDAANNAKLRAAIKPWQEADLRARFVCVLYFIPLHGEPQAFTGYCQGHLTHTPRGQAGFGYDGLFVPDEQPAGATALTLGEMTPAAKNALSHRAKAVAQFAAWLRQEPTKAPLHR